MLSKGIGRRKAASLRLSVEPAPLTPATESIRKECAGCGSSSGESSLWDLMIASSGSGVFRISSGRDNNLLQKRDFSSSGSGLAFSCKCLCQASRLLISLRNLPYQRRDSLCESASHLMRSSLSVSRNLRSASPASSSTAARTECQITRWPSFSPEPRKAAR